MTRLYFIISVIFLLNTGCKKFLNIAPPTTTITTKEIFQNNTQAEWAIAGIYTKMIHGTATTIQNAGNENFGAGLSTLLGGLSSDEFVAAGAGSDEHLYVSQNKLNMGNYSITSNLWNSAFRIIYDANAVIEGIEASTSTELTDSARRQITGEALVLRAFSYFYLVNFYGELPLALSTDFNETNALQRSPVNIIYDQIKSDLLRAKSLLVADLSVGKGEKVRINRWFAEALLARVYLYTKEHQLAIDAANAVLQQQHLFSMEPDLANVFLKTSKEAIFQLKSTTAHNTLRAATPEGYMFNNRYGGVSGLIPVLALSNELLNAFENNDKRKTTWLTSRYAGYFAPFKYKTAGGAIGAQTEYYTVMRLAELYLIRAEAKVLLSDGNKDEAIDDINVLRQRADVPLLEKSLTAQQVIAALEHERRTEFFAEWGHRWFDLKRTGRAHDVLSAVSYKQPWLGDYQFLYPVPAIEIQNNNNLKQNPEYGFQ
jgi:starch-binding outer membrane protein, SusD/RagB family